MLWALGQPVAFAGLLIAFVTVGLCAPVFAQTNTGRILGTIQDSTGAVVANAGSSRSARTVMSGSATPVSVR